MSEIRVLALSGSLRRDSFNTRLLHFAEEIAPRGTVFDHYEGLGDIPHFNEDTEHPAPAPVADLRARVRAADAVLIATPEYNSSYPGSLKNALDWLSRADDNGLTLPGKPTAILGASPGLLGTVRAQLALRQVLHKLDANVVRQPEFLLFNAHQQFGEKGLEKDSPAAQPLGTVLGGLVDLVQQDRLAV
ncbi:NADPH-dependent FMN reductase [Streptomyces sp. NPDC047079]|uniref:NADPH-dependent FMN reductase n=1 Tax=Streptomyces sp. NPDC047079 TaxID=3154607 RepID=UPI0033EDC536